MKIFPLTITLTAVLLAGCATKGTEDLPPGVHKVGALAGGPNFNDPLFMARTALDLEPQPLAFVDAAVFDGGLLADGGLNPVGLDAGWYPSGGKYPKGILIDCGSTKATIYLDLLGMNGKAPASNQPVALACNVWHEMAITKVWQTGLLSTDGGTNTTVFLKY